MKGREWGGWGVGVSRKGGCEVRARGEGRREVAVMGAGFSEGIDLTGERLIGCFIVGVGLPQINFHQNLIQDYYQTDSQLGFAYAYQYPGITKVLQS